MDMVLNIFIQLGADKTLAVQFVIVCIMLVASKFLFLSHLQEIIEKREEKTVGLEGSAEKELERVNALSEEYKSNLNAANKEIRENTETKKNTISKELESKYRDEEKSMNDYIDESRKSAELKVSEQKEKLFGQAEELTASLVQKITKG